MARSPGASAGTRSVVNEQAFRQALREGPLGFAVVSAQGRFVEVNKTLCDMLGYTEREMLGFGIYDVTHPDDLAENRPLTRQLFEGKIPSFRLRKRYLRRDGSILWIMLYAHPVGGDGGPVKFAVGVIEDITDRIEADAVRRRSEKYQEMLGFILESMAEGVLMLTDEGLILNANARLEEIFGYQPGELLGRSVSVLNEDAPVGGALAQMENTLAAMRSSARATLDLRCVRKDGSSFRCRSRISRFQHPVYGPVLLSVSEDVTEQQQSLERVRALHGELERTIAELRRSNEDLQQFAYVTSHDLREPLRTIAGFSELLSRRLGERLEDEHREFLDYVIQAATRMDRLIVDLLAYSSVGASLRLQRVSCSDVVKEATVQLASAVAESGAEIVHGELPTVVADPLLLRQVFQNLIGNAVKFRGPNPPRVEIAAERRDAEWRFRVRDNGIGMEPSQVQRIFLLFQRLHPQSEYPGSGIGLAMCKKIVERHGGRLWVDSCAGEGSTFHFTLAD